MLLDALQENNSNYILAAKKIVVKIITKKFGISNVTVVTAREHGLQYDNSLIMQNKFAKVFINQELVLLDCFIMKPCLTTNITANGEIAFFSRLKYVSLFSWVLLERFCFSWKENDHYVTFLNLPNKIIIEKYFRYIF